MDGLRLPACLNLRSFPKGTLVGKKSLRGDFAYWNGYAPRRVVAITVRGPNRPTWIGSAGSYDSTGGVIRRRWENAKSLRF
jgi:hypothetical protein